MIMTEAKKAAYAGIMTVLAGAFSDVVLGPAHVDRTGLELKITFESHVDCLLSSKSTPEHLKREYTRTVYLACSIPRIPLLSVGHGPCFPYSRAAMHEMRFMDGLSYGERVGMVDWTNSFGPPGASRWTAAAYQMGWFFVNHLLLPQLGLQQAGWLASVPAAAHSLPNSHIHDVMLPNYLTYGHSFASLNIIFHACVAADVMHAAGLPPCSVLNLCGTLPDTPVDADSFWEAYAVLCVSACGSGSKAQFEAEFLTVVVQNFKLHSLSDEGGIYCRFWDNLPIEPNRGVVASDSRRSHSGHYVDRSISFVLNAALGLQTATSRALHEYCGAHNWMILPPGCSNEDAGQASTQVVHELRRLLAHSTGLPEDYWRNSIHTFRNYDARDGHISRVRINDLRYYSTWLPSYAFYHEVSKDGAVRCPAGGYYYAELSGDGQMQRYTHDGTHSVDLNLNSTNNPKNGIFWHRPGINPRNGIAQMQFIAASFANPAFPSSMRHGAIGSFATSIMTSTGAQLNAGDLVGDHAWRDNGDFFPCEGDINTPVPCVSYGTVQGADPFFEEYKYVIRFARYFPLSPQPHESRSQTRMRSAQLQRARALPPDSGHERPRATQMQILRNFHFNIRQQMLPSNTISKLQRDWVTAMGSEDKCLIEHAGLDSSVKGAAAIEQSADLLNKLEVLIRITDSLHQESLRGSEKRTLDAGTRLAFNLKKAVDERVETIFSFVTSDDVEEARLEASKERAPAEHKQRARGPLPPVLRFGGHALARQWDADTYLAELIDYTRSLRNRFAILEDAVQMYVCTYNSLVPDESAVVLPRIREGMLAGDMLSKGAVDWMNDSIRTTDDEGEGEQFFGTQDDMLEQGDLCTAASAFLGGDTTSNSYKPPRVRLPINTMETARAASEAFQTKFRALFEL